MSILPTNSYRLQNALNFIDSVEAANNYYFFISNFIPQANSSPQPLYDITSNNYTAVWNNMIQGKQIVSGDLFSVVNNIQWTANTVYAMYDDLDANLPQEQFFVITSDGTNYYFWKCLDNNFGIVSTIEPIYADIAANPYYTVVEANPEPYYQTADGYRWKYMTSVPVATGTLFETADYFPCQANAVVAAAAVPGSVEIFKITGNGAFYNNYINGTLKTTDINIVNGNANVFNISNSSVIATNGYYNNCIVYLTGGTSSNGSAVAGQYATITNYTVNSTGCLFTTNTSFFPYPTNGTTYEINPQVSIISNGQQTINCVARALVNSLASNSIYRIEVLTIGAGYQSIVNSSVMVSSVVGVNNYATIRAIMSPPGGHGANALAELYSNSVGISISLANTETNSILTTNDYQQIGIMEGPIFSNVVVAFSTVDNGPFVLGETVYTVLLTQINANVMVANASSTVNCAGASFVSQLAANESIVIYDGTSQYQLAVVNTVVNSSQITLNSNINFTSTVATLSSVDFTGNGVVTTGGTSPITITNCTPTFLSTYNVLGAVSGAYGTITSVTRNGVSKYFNTFIELYKYTASVSSGTFVANEILTQGTNSGYYFGANGTSGTIQLYVGNFTGNSFSTGAIVGATSGAQATISTLYGPEIIFGSAEILYLENIMAVTRSNNQTETFNFVLNF